MYPQQPFVGRLELGLYLQHNAVKQWGMGQETRGRGGITVLLEVWDAGRVCCVFGLYACHKFYEIEAGLGLWNSAQL